MKVLMYIFYELKKKMLAEMLAEMTVIQGSIYTCIIIQMLQAITCCMTGFLASDLKKKKGMAILAGSSFCIPSLPVAVWMLTAVLRFLCGVWMSRHMQDRCRYTAQEPVWLVKYLLKSSLSPTWKIQIISTGELYREQIQWRATKKNPGNLFSLLQPKKGS